MFDIHTTQVAVGGETLALETGRMARQAHGAVYATCGGTAVLATAVANHEPRQGVDFLPLTVNYQAKTFAAGKIPGGFFKREGKPPDAETLTSRLIDRSLRPLFPKGFACETQVIATVLSHDGENPPDVVALVAASAALALSDVPFAGPVGCVRVGHVDGEYVINPTYQQLEASRLDLIVAGTRDAVTMVESGSKMLGEEEVLGAIEAGHAEIRRLAEMQEEFARAAGRPKREAPPAQTDPTVAERAAAFFCEYGRRALAEPTKEARESALREARTALTGLLSDPERLRAREYLAAFDARVRAHVRGEVLDRGIRVDGRGTGEVRPIAVEAGCLARTHGSALFTRGETQALVAATLGTSRDEQLIEALEGSHYKRFLLHYNFPPFATGEARFLRMPSRREVGHGALAERALAPVLPSHEDFPYTIRLVSEVLESNGSSSMATVCGGSLALMDAGVPVTAAVAGVAMGLIAEGERYAVLTDILGDEDHLGDMDFKVAGTREGITALQMDIKVRGLTREILAAALAEARRARLHILDRMEEALAAPRADLSPWAPRITVIHVSPEKIRTVIGPGGKTIRAIVAATQAAIDVEDDGSVRVASSDEARAQEAIRMIRDLTQEAEVGKVYQGVVRRIMDFGAFVEIFPGTDGLVHISEIAHERVATVTDYLKEGDEVPVKVLHVDASGKIKLSRKAALEAEAASAAEAG
ncbi:MAG: polyribonucleotide nucleotidyltransferase [Deferrisomatales bacterium]|nr:polyribonucleotide nucleotidyltransferase [Deferrisomatales bacterium]